MDRPAAKGSGNSASERQSRLDKALRENLKKRKQQQRARSSLDKSEETTKNNLRYNPVGITGAHES